jgi:hypothetical protein
MMRGRSVLWAVLSGGVCFGAAPSAYARGPDPDTLVVGDPGKTFGDGGRGIVPTWSSQLPPLVLTLSFRSLSYSPSSHDSFDGNVETSPLAYKFSGDALGGAVRAYGFEMGLYWYPTPFTYLGPSLGLGWGKHNGGSFVSDALTIEPRDSINVSVTTFGGVAGLRLPLGPVSVRAEMLAGGDWISIDQYASNAANRLTSTASAVAPLLEPRAAIDLWVTPFATVSLFGAMPSFDPRATDVGLVLSGHLRAFDGKYGLF